MEQSCLASLMAMQSVTRSGRHFSSRIVAIIAEESRVAEESRQRLFH